MKNTVFYQTLKSFMCAARSLRKNQNGFSLIELSIGLIILSLIAGPMLMMFNIDQQRGKIYEVQATLSSVRNHINSFVETHGRYPCPASLLAAPGDVEHGVEPEDAAGVYSCVSSNVPPCNATNPPTIPPEGFCSVGYGIDDRIVIGAIPFKALKITEENSLDTWQRKILYAVSMAQADSATFQARDPSAGALLVFEWSGDDDLTSRSNIDFILVSHGPNGKGAYSKEGDLIDPCPDNLNSDGLERWNCDLTTSFMLDSDGRAQAAEADSIFPYDDITLHQDNYQLRYWFQGTEVPENVLTIASVLSIGQDEVNPSPNAAIHLGSGDIRVDGKISTGLLCDKNGENCFDPKIIARYSPQMLCDSENQFPGMQPVVAINQNSVECLTVVDSLGNPIDGRAFVLDDGMFEPRNCALEGKLAYGINSNGELLCRVPQ